MVEGQILRGDASRPVAEICIMDLKKLGGDGGGAGHDNVDGAQFQPEQRPVNLGKGLQGVVRLLPELQKVAQNRQALGPRREWRPVRAILLPSET